jgi:hypothetical protein
MCELSEMTSDIMIKRLRELDTHVLPMNNKSFRMVTNLMVTKKQSREALEQIRSILS